jgi:hypothetical protein
MRFTKFVAMFGLFSVAIGAAPNDQPIMGWIATYYQTHDATRFGEFWDKTVGRGVLEANPPAREFTVGFLSQFFRQHPELLMERIARVDQYPEKQRDAIRLILWWVDTEYTRNVLKKYGDGHMLKIKPPPIEFRPICNSWDIEFFEGWFFASGDLDALKPILDLIIKGGWASDDPRPGVATQILEELCSREYKVRDFVVKYLENRVLSDESKVVIQKILVKCAGPK